jgi:regulator of protease activity HflC (stomatin/prohibitin superfamily)
MGLFFKVNDPEKQQLKVEKFNFAIHNLQAALRDVCGKVELDTILSKREEMGKTLKPLLRKKQKFGV